MKTSKEVFYEELISYAKTSATSTLKSALLINDLKKLVDFDPELVHMLSGLATLYMAEIDAANDIREYAEKKQTTK